MSLAKMFSRSSRLLGQVLKRNEAKNLPKTHFPRPIYYLSVENEPVEEMICRALSTIHQTMVKPPPISSLASKEQSRDFMALFPDVVRELTDAGKHQEMPEVMRRFARMLQYTVPTGKKNRGLTVISSYNLLEDPQNLTPENLGLANILGWCVEMVQGFLVVVDDVLDESETRRGVACWYRQPDVGLSAFNDALMVENAVYALLKKHFRDHPAYLLMMELFHDVIFKTAMGQSLDLMCMDNNGKPKLDMFTMHRYTSIVRYKTAYYSFQMPVALAMYLANLHDTEQHRQAKTILLEMGQFFQIQDDFLDCFGDSAIMGKKGTDIEDGKCSWLAVVALQRASPSQRKIMEDHYGKSDLESVQAIRHLYEELSLPNTYAIYEEESFNIIKTHIQQISKGLPHKLFFKIMERLYKREC
ncbi:farnesyl pyrophosphate synthase isoform X2 [Cylas formicarius]|uniref:farnesyl pyrophosphate synthase isoform X2 n=1 Tax=Cylas formicarius TaxID=197179 RepID=UPI0029583678|nr:farnesyl pyrophosphate synthase isoform X2 [Cylas formicarius]